MLKRNIMKKLMAFILMVSVVLPVFPIQTKAMFTEILIETVLTKGIAVVDRAIMKGMNRATTGLEDDSPIVIISELLLGSNASKDTLEACQEILYEVKEVDANVTATRNYLAQLIANLAIDGKYNNLTEKAGEINAATSEITIAWNAYIAYLTAAEKYAASIQAADDEAQLKTAWDVLFEKLDAMDFEAILTDYVALVSTELAHYGSSGQINPSRTYLDLLYEVCTTVYPFDYQIYEAMESGINMNVAYLQHAMELYTVYMQAQINEYEIAYAVADDAEKAQLDADMEVTRKQYENGMNIAVNAVNNVVDQYFDEMQGMMRRYDLHVQYEMDYTSEKDVTAAYIMDYPTLKDQEYELEYHTKADNTKPVMDFYRVRAVNGETYLFLKQSNDELEDAGLVRNEISLDSLVEFFEAEDPKSFFGHIEGRMESMDWMNLLQTKDGKYTALKSVNDISGMVSQLMYAALGNANFLQYVLAGGLTAVQGDSGNASTYLFIDDADMGVYDYGGVGFSRDVFIDIYWAELAKMSLTDDGFATDSAKSSLEYQYESKDNENVLVLLQEAEDATFAYPVNQQVQGNGSMEITVEDVQIGSTVEAGQLMTITLTPEENQKLDSLVIKGEDKDWIVTPEVALQQLKDAGVTIADEEQKLAKLQMEYENSILNETLAASGDYDVAPKGEDGSVTYSFVMPYQECTVTASFVKDVDKYNRITINYMHDTTHDGSGYAMVWDEAENVVIDYDDPSGTQGYAVFGETLTANLYPGNGCYIASVNLTDMEGNKILDLSCLNEVHFVMPNQDCMLNIEYVEQTGKGTMDDPYLIPNYAKLCEYINLTQGWNAEGSDTIEDSLRDQYRNAHYRVTQSFGGVSTSPIAGMYLSAEGGFDGQNHVISDLNLAHGLFETIEAGAEVKNVVLSGIVVDSRVGNAYPEGGVLAKTNYGTISHCEIKAVDADTTGKTALGGIAYENYGVIRNSGVDVSSKLSAENLGGITYINEGQIQNSYFCGTLSPTNASGMAAGITLIGNGKGQIDNCYSAGQFSADGGVSSMAADFMGPILRMDLVTSGFANADRVYYETESTLVSGTEVGTNYDVLKNDAFKDVMNAYGGTNTLPEGYLTWVRFDDVNGGYPTFAGQALYEVSEKVTGSGSVLITRENGANMSTGIYSGELICVAVERPEGVVLNSLQLQDADGNVLQDFATTGEDVSFVMPSQNVVVTADFTNLSTELTIAAKIDGVGKINITDANGAPITSARTNDIVSVEALAGKNNTLSALQLWDEAGNVIETFSSAAVNFTMGSKNCVLYAKFVETASLYQVSANVIGNGSVTLLKPDQTVITAGVEANTTIQVKAEPAEGAYVSSIKVLDTEDNEVLVLTDSYKDYLRDKEDDGTYRTSFNMPATDVVVEVVYETIPDLYKVTAEITGDGMAQVDVKEGFWYQGNATANTVLIIRSIPNTADGVVESVAAYDAEGNKLEDLTVDDGYVAEANELQYEYVVPDQDVTLKIVFSESPYQLDDEDGDGVYEIASYEDLVSMAYLIQRDPSAYAAARYKQVNNITCGMQTWDLEIGTEEVPFEGDYEGGDFYVLGLRPTSEVSGLFGVIGSGGVVRNLKVVDFDYVEAAEMAGGLAGINRGTILDCSSGINITSAATVFRNNGQAVPITDLDSEIKATSIAGGLAAINEGTIRSSRSNANVASGDIAGGITGVNTGTIQNVYQTGEVSSVNIAGGIVGANNGLIEYGYNNNEVTGTVIGAIAGTSENNRIREFWYVNTMSAACSNVADSELDVTAMALEDMAAAAFADTLNAAIKDEGFAAWSYASSKNAGYPTLESTVVVEQVLRSSNRMFSIRGRIQPGATVKLVRVTDGDTEYLTFQEAMDLGMVKEALKNGKFSDGWKLALMHADGTYALWEGKLTITITLERLNELKDRLILLLSEGGEYKLPKFTVEGNTLTIETDELGSFALIEQDEVKDESPDQIENEKNESSDNAGQENSDHSSLDTGDHTNVFSVVMVLAMAVIALAVLIIVKKKGIRNE